MTLLKGGRLGIYFHRKAAKDAKIVLLLANKIRAIAEKTSFGIDKHLVSETYDRMRTARPTPFK
jgi:hypothetical protein